MTLTSPHNRSGQIWASMRIAASPGGRGMAMLSCVTAKTRHRLSTSSTRSDVWRKRTSKAVQMHCPHETPAENDRKLPSLSSQWLEGSAVGMKQRVRGIAGLPCPSQEKGNRYCDVLMASQFVRLSGVRFAPYRAKCAPTNPSERLSLERKHRASSNRRGRKDKAAECQ